MPQGTPQGVTTASLLVIILVAAAIGAIVGGIIGTSLETAPLALVSGFVATIVAMAIRGTVMREARPPASARTSEAPSGKYARKCAVLSEISPGGEPGSARLDA